MNIPVKFSRNPGSIRRPVPRLDENHVKIVEEATGSKTLKQTRGGNK